MRNILKNHIKKIFVLSLTMVTIASSFSSEPVNSLPLPKDNHEFIFCSGAGAWETKLSLNRDGTFEGYYYDANMGEMAEDYPEGTMMVCSFSGKFSSLGKINDYSYKMILSNVKTEDPSGKEWIKDGMRYVASRPYGLEDGKEFVLYLPDTDVSKVSTEFLSWWPYRYDKDTLSCYGIYNITKGYGFFDAI